MEILVVVSVIAAMSSIAFPAADNFYASQFTTAQAAILIADIRLARANAMDKQVYHRLLFSSDKTEWIVQEYTDSSGLELPGEVDSADIGIGTAKSDTFEVVSAKWLSALDSESRKVDPGITIETAPAIPSAIFFRPDGMIVDKPTFEGCPIPVLKVTFKKSSAATDVSITPAGGIESVEWFDENY